MKYYYSTSIFSTVCALALAVATPSTAQPPADPPTAPVTLTDFKIENASAPGAGTWLRLLAGFRSTPRWADGIAFHYEVLLERGGRFRVLTGTVRYANVKAGTHAAVLYLSPSTVERFGAPIAAIVGAVYDEEAGAPLKWVAPGQQAPEGWNSQYERYPSLLQPIYLTPFVATEYGKFPDVLGSQ